MPSPPPSSRRTGLRFWSRLPPVRGPSPQAGCHDIRRAFFDERAASTTECPFSGNCAWSRTAASLKYSLRVAASTRTRVGIVGTGWVGSSVAISTLHAGFADELLLCDTRSDVAEGEAMDLSHGASFYPAATVRSAPLAELREPDALVVAAGRGGRPGP